MLRRIIRIAVSCGSVIMVDIMILSHLPGYHIFFNLPVICIIIVSLLTNWRYGTIAALVLGYIMSLYSILPWVTYPLALICTAITSGVILRRIFAGRAQVSLLATVSLGTILFGGIVLLVSTVSHQLFHYPWFLPTQPFIWILLLQSVIHSVLVGGIWRILRRDQYYRLGTAYNQPF